MSTKPMKKRILEHLSDEELLAKPPVEIALENYCSGTTVRSECKKRGLDPTSPKKEEAKVRDKRIQNYIDLNGTHNISAYTIAEACDTSAATIYIYMKKHKIKSTKESSYVEREKLIIPSDLVDLSSKQLLDKYKISHARIKQLRKDIGYEFMGNNRKPKYDWKLHDPTKSYKENMEIIGCSMGAIQHFRKSIKEKK